MQRHVTQVKRWKRRNLLGEDLEFQGPGKEGAAIANAPAIIVPCCPAAQLVVMHVLG